MSRTFADVLYDLQFVRPKDAAARAFKSTEEPMLSLVAEQMAAGKTGADQVIVSPYTGEPYYSESYKKYKQIYGVGIGKVTDRITLNLTGAHYRSLYTRMKGNQVEIGSTLDYGVEFNKNNPELYQLGTQLGQDYINDHLEPAFWDEMKKELNK
ncbi:MULTISPECIES: hypothetical protein [unclassified Paraflavitalea]|uniref:hypothetical protein n=1 Tax=unclassified Paraflavitalea TaxID=2798305 RepID=UPI003D32FFE6